MLFNKYLCGWLRRLFSLQFLVDGQPVNLLLYPFLRLLESEKQ